MRYSSLPQLEERFKSSGNNGEYSLRPFSIPVPGEQLTLEGLVCSPNNRSGFYHDVVHPKQQILLHYTAGQLVSDLSALTQKDYHVSVAFVIARDGTIYQLFPSKFWSGHIGKGLGNIGTGNARDKQSVAIELSNYGYLVERDGNLETVYSRMKDAHGNTGPVDIYCSLTETAAYQKLATPFRGQKYYATFTKQQYDSLIILLRYLTAQYQIPRAFLPESTRFETTNDVLNFNGIVSHVNYRINGKWDIGPAFDWQQVITGVQADSFQPTTDRALETIATPKSVINEVITSEKAIETIVPAALDKNKEDEEYDEKEAEKNIHNDKQKKLFALLVGINAYRADIILEGRVRFPELRGCVEDSRKMQKYLEQDDSFDKKIVSLNNQDATKEAIVNAFRQHLSQAGEGDVALFYYSGHGTQEWADRDVWTSEADGRLECIACYYDEQRQNEFLLADKEIRFLINELAKSKAHIVTIFDCCHSADNTRNGAYATTVFSETLEKRIPFSFTKRNWQDFIFGNTIQRDQIIAQGEATILPEGMHVQFSACESDESAVEVSGEGVFTKTLLKVLDASGGDISYYALQNRVRQYLRNVYEQKPRIYVPDGNETMLYSTFLDKVATSNKTFAEVTYNAASGWQLNLGGIHGLGEKTKLISIIDSENNKTYTANITSIGTDYSFLSLEGALDTSKVYKGYVENLMSQTLQVHLKNDDGSPQDQQALFDGLFNSKGSDIVFEDQEERAQYVVRSRNGQYYITLPGDEFRPRLQPVVAKDEGSIANVATYLKQISQWEFLKNLTNQNDQTRIGKDGLQIELFQVDALGTKKPVDISNDAVLPYERTPKGWKTAILVRLTNQSGRNLYCATLHLTTFFGSSLKLLNPTVKMLEPGNSVELQFNNNPILASSFSDVVKTYNWKEEIEYLKLIISTEDFNAQQHAMTPLPPPPVPGSRSAARMRGLEAGTDMDQEIEQGWTTQLITLRFPNPEYNQISEATLAELLNTPETADFALGIYFDASVDENMQPSHQLKPEIIITGPATGERGIRDKIIDVANWWARGQRNKHYDQVIKRFPDRLRIVSEGDSWFQHPLVLDIIDHLSRVYAIYCVAAAGDTLRNYLSQEKKNGEFFLDAIDEQKPAFFLISGGGNDILGSQFRGFLAENPDQSSPEGENPKRFLKPSIFDELNSLMDIYKSLFGFLETHKPNLQVIVHGYDYPVKLNDAKSGWLGRYMIEKGISRPKDRQAVIRLIMDTFNKGISEAAKDFKNVTYIDVRNTVRFNGVDQWYDEIHPNNDGFQQVAMKFMQVIDRICKEKFGAKTTPPDDSKLPTDKMEERKEVLFSTERERGAETQTRYRGQKAKPPMAEASPKPDVRDGQLEYEIPDLMETGKLHECKVRIAGEEVALDYLKISSKSLHEKIQVSDEMMVKLIDPSGGENFDITELNSQWQGIFTDQFTEWNFNVRPKKSGRFELLLRISIKSQGRTKDINILEKEVLVSASPADQPTSIKKILFLCANPDDTERLKVNIESERIKEALENSSHRNEILFVTNMAATPRNMIKYLLREKPAFVHFSGHGSEDGLYLEDENGISKPIPGTALELLFKGFKSDVKCVVFNSCYSESQAQVIVKYIPHVIGMKQAVKDKAANAFSIGFYQAIGEGQDIEPAFQIGLASMAMESSGQEDVPVLLPEH